MGTPTWQRRLLETLTRIDAGQVVVVERLGSIETRLQTLETGQLAVVAEIRRLGDRLDNTLRITGQADRRIEERVARLEDAVFPPDRGR